MKAALTAAGASLVGLGLAQLAKGRPRRRNAIACLTETLEDGADGVASAVYQSTSFEFTDGNKITWCHDRKIFEAIGEAVNHARESIHIDTYIWKPGEPGDTLARQVIAAARRGVDVRVMVDPVGSEGFQDGLCQSLSDAGVKVNFFRPPRLKPFKVWGRNHRKLVVVDGRIGFTGGFGVGPEWLTWRDSNVRVEGPVVRQMQQAFAAHWLEVGGGLLPTRELRRTERAGTSRACFVTSTDVKGHSNAHWVTSITVAAAKHQLWIANAYFFPPPTLMRLLSESAAKGVDLRILLPGPYNDHLWMKALQRSRYPALSHQGVRLFEYQSEMMHSKTALVDGRLVVVGSINLDLLSQEVLEEGSLVIDDPAVASELQAQWDQDLAQSLEVFSGQRLPAHTGQGERPHRPSPAMPP